MCVSLSALVIVVNCIACLSLPVSGIGTSSSTLAGAAIRTAISRDIVAQFLSPTAKYTVYIIGSKRGQRQRRSELATTTSVSPRQPTSLAAMSCYVCQIYSL